MFLPKICRASLLVTKMFMDRISFNLSHDGKFIYSKTLKIIPILVYSIQMQHDWKKSLLILMSKLHSTLLVFDMSFIYVVINGLSKSFL